MKEYIETFTNPRTNQIEDIKVYEYSFEDWQNGIINTNFSAGKRLTFNINKQAFEYNYLPINEKKKMIENAKEIYLNKVEIETNLFKTILAQRLELSQAKEILIQTEIESYNKLLSDDLLPIKLLSNINHPLELVLPFYSYSLPNINPDTREFEGFKTIKRYESQKIYTIKIYSIRKTYKKIIVEGIKDYSLTNSPNQNFQIGSGDSHYIRVEAIHNYIQHLKTISEELNQSSKTSLKMSSIEVEIFTTEQFEIYNILIDKYHNRTNSSLQKAKVIFQYLRSIYGLHHSRKDKYIQYINTTYLKDKEEKLRPFNDIADFTKYTNELEKLVSKNK